MKIRVFFIVFIAFLFIPDSNAKHYLEENASYGIYYETSENNYLLYGQFRNRVKIPDAGDNEYIALSVTYSSLIDCISGQFLNRQAFYYRQEGNKIYRYDMLSGKDKLVYEFGLSKGDIVQDGDGNRMIVEEVLQAKELSEYCTLEENDSAYILRDLNNPSNEDIWIDKVGSIKTGIFLPSDFDGMQKSCLSFYSSSNGHHSIAFPLNTNYLKASPFVKHNPLDDIESEFYDDSDDDGSYSYEINDNDIADYMHFEFTDDTLNIKGRLNRRMCPEGFDIIGSIIVDDVINLFFQNLHYLETEIESIGDSDFEVKIPDFKSGMYKIKTTPIFMEIADTVLICNGPASGIKGINEDKAERAFSDNIYDLSGRRLSCPPEHGVYIQGGRVRVK